MAKINMTHNNYLAFFDTTFIIDLVEPTYRTLLPQAINNSFLELYQNSSLRSLDELDLEAATVGGLAVAAAGIVEVAVSRFGRGLCVIPRKSK